MTILLICLAAAAVAALVGVAVDPCSVDSMVDGSVCIDNLSDREKLAADVFYLCQEVAACSSADCTIDGLEEDAKCLKHLSNEKLSSILVYSDLVAAQSAGADLDGSMDELQNGIKCLKLLDDTQLMAMQVVLRCRLQNCVEPLIL